MGSTLAATPDGRLAGESTSLNTGASFGADREGITAHILSVTTIDSSDSPNSVTLDLDTIEGAENFKYVRAEVFGKGGLCLTQALIIDNGTDTLTYEKSKDLISFVKDLIFMLKSSRFWTIIVELYRMI